MKLSEKLLKEGFVLTWINNKEGNVSPSFDPREIIKAIEQLEHENKELKTACMEARFDLEKLGEVEAERDKYKRDTDVMTMEWKAVLKDRDIWKKACEQIMTCFKLMPFPQKVLSPEELTIKHFYKQAKQELEKE
jgi:hypothetical protein